MTKQRQLERKKYPLELSPLYKLSNKKKLAEIIGIDYKDIANFSKSDLPNQYNIFTDSKTLRFITQPINNLNEVHGRLLKLFVRIAPPNYIHSATKNKSYKSNAEMHTEAFNFIKIDIKKFFPSVKFSYIYNFFSNDLKCSPDVAVILSKLCTVNTKFGTHLPTGSCISPILSFLANKKLFDSIELLADNHGCTFTLYVDDITISGKNATRFLLSSVAKEIHKFGYAHHKYKIYKQVPAKVTGLFIHNGQLQIPHERAKKIRELAETLDNAVGTSRPKLLSSLIGRLSEAEQVNGFYKIKRLELMKRYRAEWNQITTNRIRKSLYKSTEK